MRSWSAEGTTDWSRAPIWPGRALDTIVLEARHKTGGAATTEAPVAGRSGVPVTRLSYVMSLLPPTIINDLDLERNGYKMYPMGPYYQAFPEGGSIKLFADDAKRTTRRSSSGRRRTPTPCRAGTPGSAGLADVLGPLLLTVPPKLGSRKPARPHRDAPARLAPPRPERPHDRRRDPADDDVASPTCSTTGSSRRR